MRAVVRLRLGTTLLVSLALAGAPGVAGPAGAAAEVPVCEQPVPAATDGVLTLDSSTARPGTPALGILTAFPQWPTILVGGGSGETFLSCTPWTPHGAAEVMPPREPALFLVDVPAGTPAGEHPVGVVFAVGPIVPFEPGTRVRLSSTLTVSPDHVPAPGSSAVCALPADAAPSGRLVVPGTATAGGTVSLGLADVAGQVGGFNEYDTLSSVACVDGVATPVVQDLASGASVEVAVPAGSSPGRRSVRLLGVLDDRTVWWESTVAVTAPGTTALAQLPGTGSPVTPVAAALGAGSLLLGLALVHARSRRRAGAGSR